MDDHQNYYRERCRECRCLLALERDILALEYRHFIIFLLRISSQGPSQFVDWIKIVAKNVPAGGNASNRRKKANESKKRSTNLIHRISVPRSTKLLRKCGINAQQRDSLRRRPWQKKRPGEIWTVLLSRLVPTRVSSKRDTRRSIDTDSLDKHSSGIVHAARTIQPGEKK